MPTGISYVNETWNPVVGCTKCSPGCENCYAEKLHNMRHRAYLAGKKVPKQYAKPFSEIQLFTERLNIPLHWRQPRRILVPSMGDLFHEKVPFEFIDKVFVNMALCPQHTFLVLTKRVERMAEYCNNPKTPFNTNKIIKFPFPNVHLGVTICNQKEADEKIPILLQIPAAHRWLSIEPCLGEIDLKQIRHPLWARTQGMNVLTGKSNLSLTGIAPTTSVDGIVVGGESGPNRRPCKLEWIRSIVEQCKAAGVKCFVKQIEINGKVSHNPDEWPKWARIRERL